MKKSILIFLTALILILWVITTFFEFQFLDKASIGNLFTGLGVIGLIFTLHFQQKQISDNKEDTNTQVKNLKIQNFENRFFQLINNYQKSISLFYFSGDKNMFRTFFNDFKSCIKNGHTEQELIETYNSFRTNYENLI